MRVQLACAGRMANGNLRAGYTLRFCTLSSGPSTPSFQRNSFREIKYGFFISSLRIFSLNWSAKCPWPHGPPGDEKKGFREGAYQLMPMVSHSNFKSLF